ncbi:MAG TPA: PQQ-binding-like beta-propeller repeat protein [Acidobacteriota bacterium]|nr:PQQ-binding-like beta-propeller repeat protein [Acidobacteriota bacterium]
MLARIVVTAVLVCLHLKAADWPQFRGSEQDGRAQSENLRGLLGLDFETLWKQPLGSGYAGIVVADGRVYSMGARAGGDYVLAYRGSSGEEVWRTRISDSYRGHDGSDDGPISTPVVSEGVLYALSAHGDLAALDSQDGRLIWKRHVVDDLQGVAPFYGYSTSPIVEGDLLIIQSGAAEGVLAALDKKSGQLRWTALPGKAEYQTPLIAELAGRRQLIACSEKALVGLDPSDGSVLWKHEFERGSIDPHVVLAEDGRFLVTRSDHAEFFHLRQGTDGFQLEQLWETRSFKNTHSVPVYHEGHFYGYNGRFLTCVEARSGQDAWKSRPPGGRNLTLVGDTFLVLARGKLTAFQADPRQYRELGSRQVFEPYDTWIAPAYADSVAYVRDLDELAAVRPRPLGERPDTAERPDPALMQGAFGQFVRRLQEAPITEKHRLIQQFLQEQESFPIIEGRTVHFVFRGQVEDVAIRGDMTGGRLEDPLFHVEETDFYYRSYQAASDETAWQYHLRHYEQARPDPLNPSTLETPEGERSWAALSGWQEASLPGQPSPERLRSHEVESEAMGRSFPLKVLLPEPYNPDEPHRLALFLSDHARVYGHFDRWSDGIKAQDSGPVMAAFLDVNRPIFQIWFLRQRGDGALRMLAEELFPFLKQHYPLHDGGHLIVGHSQAAPGALMAALRYPEVFSRAGLQSPEISAGELRDDVLPLLRENQGQRFFLGYSRYELSWRPLMDFDVRESSRLLAQELREGGFEVHVQESPGGHNWPTWRAQGSRLLKFLLQP